MLKVTSSEIQQNGFLPEQYTCYGENINPPLKIENVPENTKSFLIIIQNLSTPNSEWINWVIWNIPPETTEIKANADIPLATVGLNSFLENNYSGPCPSNQTHEIQISVYALKDVLFLNSESSFQEIMIEISQIVLSQGILTCFARSS